MRDWRDGPGRDKAEGQIRKMKDKLKTMKQRRRLERQMRGEIVGRGRGAAGRSRRVASSATTGTTPTMMVCSQRPINRVRACIAVQHPRRGPLRGSLSIEFGDELQYQMRIGQD